MKKKTRMGRPPKSKAERKGSVITIRLSKQERAIVAGAAKLAGKKLSDWVRMRLLPDLSDSKIEAAETEAVGVEPHPRVTGAS